VFDGLLPEPHNSAVLDLLFVMAHWHGLAKLRMHHDLTLDIMESVLKSLGILLRSFRDVTCPAFKTKELRREADARARRELRKANPAYRHPPSVQAGSTDVCHPVSESAAISEAPLHHQPAPEWHPSASRHSTVLAKAKAPTRRPKTFNLGTYKGHSYGDYVKSIRQYGTMDSYSTEPVRHAKYYIFLRV
jgi:hypothetical protein